MTGIGAAAANDDVERSAVHPRPAASFPGFPDVMAGDITSIDSWLDTARIESVSAVDFRLGSAWQLRRRVVPDNMWYWFRRGTGTARVGEHESLFDVSPGGIMLIPQGTEHSIRQDPGTEMELVAVHFFCTVHGGINLLDLLGFPRWLPPTADDPYAVVNARLAREAAVQAPGWRSALASGVREILTYAVRHAGGRFRSRAHPDLPRLLPALTWLETRLEDPNLRVGDLAARVHLSEVQFRKLFGRAIGTTPGGFIQRRRIDRACILLRTGDATVEQVARRTGFSDAPYFSRVFKSRTGTTPGRYRTSDPESV